MKKLIGLSTALLLLVFSTIAMAIPSLPNGPLYIKFDGIEQVSPTGSIVSPESNAENSWGIFSVSSMADGDTGSDDQNFNAGPQFWTQSGNPGYITGIFFGLTNVANQEDLLLSSGGEIHFYFTETIPTAFGSTDYTDRWDDGLDDTFPTYTDGTLLAQIEFIDGAIRADASVVGTAVPDVNGGFFGVANSFGNVKDSNNDGVIDGNDGAWAEYLATKYFDTPLLGANSADVKFRNVYERTATAGNNWDDLENDIFGADFTDPARAYSNIPEPATMALFGLGLLGLAGISRRRKDDN